MGSACHEVAEVYVKDGHYLELDALHEKVLLGEMTDEEVQAAITERITALWEDAYWNHFADRVKYDEGLDLTVKWALRQNWDGREVYSTEVKDCFVLHTSAGDIPFNYIWDRCDILERWEDGPHKGEPKTVEVIDYKTWVMPVQAAQIKDKIQTRCYGVSAQLQFPTATRIWITLDQWRYDTVSAVITIEQNRDTYRYLMRLIERIIADDTAEERLNPECRWCIRSGVCETLIKHAKAGGSLALTDPNEAADRRDLLNSAKGGLERAITEIDAFLMEHLRRENEMGFDTEATVVSVSTRSQRGIDTRLVARIVGAEMVADAGKLTMGVIDEWLKKGSVLTDEQRSRVRQLITKTAGSPTIKTTPKGVFEET